jgi:hypothetical protein
MPISARTAKGEPRPSAYPACARTRGKRVGCQATHQAMLVHFAGPHCAAPDEPHKPSQQQPAALTPGCPSRTRPSGC